MQKSESIGKIAKALAKVQSGLQTVQKDGSAKIYSHKGNYEYEYLTFGSIWDCCRQLLAENNLAVCQPTEVTDGREVIVETILMHESGEWISGKISLPITQNTPQAVGSAITYGRRYSFAGIIGIVADEDDDGQNAAKPPVNKTNKTPPSNVTQMPETNKKVTEYPKEVEQICQELKYSSESKETCLKRFDSFKTENEKYNALVKMREKLAEYNKRYPVETEIEPTESAPKTLREYVQEQDAQPKLAPRELAAIQIYEGLRDEKSEVNLTAQGDKLILFCPNDKGEWQDFTVSHANGKTTCDCVPFVSISRSKPEFVCEHINGVNKYLEWKKAFEEAA